MTKADDPFDRVFDLGLNLLHGELSSPGQSELDGLEKCLIKEVSAVAKELANAHIEDQIKRLLNSVYVALPMAFVDPNIGTVLLAIRAVRNVARQCWSTARPSQAASSPRQSTRLAHQAMQAKYVRGLHEFALARVAGPACRDVALGNAREALGEFVAAVTSGDGELNGDYPMGFAALAANAHLHLSAILVIHACDPSCPDPDAIYRMALWHMHMAVIADPRHCLTRVDREWLDRLGGPKHVELTSSLRNAEEALKSALERPSNPRSDLLSAFQSVPYLWPLAFIPGVREVFFVGVLAKAAVSEREARVAFQALRDRPSQISAQIPENLRAAAKAALRPQCDASDQGTSLAL